MSHLLNNRERDFYSSWDDIIKNKKEVLNFWENLGFLEGIGAEYEKTLSYWYEYGASLLIKNGYRNKDHGVVIGYLPVIRRIYRKLLLSDDKLYGLGDLTIEEKRDIINLFFIYKQKIFEEILDKLILVYDEQIPFLYKIHDGEIVDVEAEALSSYSEIMGSYIRNLAVDINNYLNGNLNKNHKKYKSIDRVFKIRNIIEKEEINYLEDFSI